MRKLFGMLGLQYDNIKTTTSTKTLKYYNQRWNNVYGFIKTQLTIYKGILPLNESQNEVYHYLYSKSLLGCELFVILLFKFIN